VSFLKGFDGRDRAQVEPGMHEQRRSTRSGLLATGTLACNRCDAPVAPIGAMLPSDPLACPFCANRATVREFLSLELPSRPARVTVKVVDRAGLLRGR
jgi:hypothetical protein